jgi:hypothetical protein
MLAAGTEAAGLDGRVGRGGGVVGMVAAEGWGATGAGVGGGAVAAGAGLAAVGAGAGAGLAVAGAPPKSTSWTLCLKNLPASFFNCSSYQHC